MKYAFPIVFVLSHLGVSAVVLGQETLSNEHFTLIAGPSGLSSLKHTNDGASFWVPCSLDIARRPEIGDRSVRPA